MTRPVHPLVFATVLLLSVCLNLAFSYLNNIVIRSPLFLDSIFTAVTAALLGPFAGMAVGLFTNILMEFQYGLTGLYWPFALCNMATGLIVGVLSRRGAFEKLYQMITVILIVTMANAFLGALVAYLVFQGNSGVPIDQITAAIADLGQSLFSASFWARIPANLVDKMFAIALAFYIRKSVYSD